MAFSTTSRNPSAMRAKSPSRPSSRPPSRTPSRPPSTVGNPSITRSKPPSTAGNFSLSRSRPSSGSKNPFVTSTKSSLGTPFSALKKPFSAKSMGVMVDEVNPADVIRNRSYQDIPFLLGFIIMLIVLVIIAQFAVRHGDPGRYIYGVDSWGNVCGRENNVPIAGVAFSGQDYSKQTYQFKFATNDIRLAFDPRLLYEELYPVICIQECTSRATSCQQLLLRNNYDFKADFIRNKICTMIKGLVLPQEKFFNVCIPSDLSEIKSSELLSALNEVNEKRKTSPSVSFDTKPVKLQEEENAMVIQILFPSVANCWRDIIYLLLISMCISIGIGCFILAFPYPVLLFVAVVVTLSLWVLAIYFWVSYGIATSRKNKFTEAAKNKQGITSTDLLADTKLVDADELLDLLLLRTFGTVEYLLPIALVNTIFAIVVTITLIQFRTSIPLTVKLFEEATRSLIHMPMILLQSLITSLAMLGFLCYVVIIAAYILSLRTPIVDKNGLVTFVKREEAPVNLLFVPHIIGCIWVIEFIYGCQDVIIGGAFCKWFFTQEKHVFDCSIFPTFRPTVDLCLYNLGSVALGSTLLIPVRCLRICLSLRVQPNAVQESYERPPGSKTYEFPTRMNKRKAYLLRSVERNKTKGDMTKADRYKPPDHVYCWDRLDYICNTVNHNAYICIGMYGEGFCINGRHSAWLLGNRIRHMFRLSMANSFLMQLCKQLVVLLTLLISIFWLQRKFGYDIASVEFLFPMVIIGNAAYVLASCFFNVFTIVFDAMFLCFAEDQIMNNGTDSYFYSSETLHDLMCLALDSDFAGNPSDKIKPASANPLQLTPSDLEALAGDDKDSDYSEYGRFYDAVSHIPHRKKDSNDDFWLWFEPLLEFPKVATPQELKPPPPTKKNRFCSYL